MTLTYESASEQVFKMLQNGIEPLMRQLIPQCKVESIRSEIRLDPYAYGEVIELRITLKIPCK